MAIFKTIHTVQGLAAIASAEATGTPINLTHMAVGDGNGNPVIPTEGQTNLVREMYRATVNRVFQSPTDPNRFSAELVIPVEEGGFVLREVGVFDADGSLFAVGNLPETYKPVAADGAYADTIVRLDFMVTNADVVTLQVDPNIAVATQAWVSNNVTACVLMPGGTTGQVLKKASNACGDIEWADPSVAEVVVKTIEENQTLAALQTVVDLVTTTTYGLALYIDGVRLRESQWTPDPVLETRLTLGTSYAAGTKLTAVQNEPTGGVGTPLIKSQNLADVPDKAIARTNLDVFSKAEARQLSPAGQVAYFARGTAPAGWLKANGAAISRTAYADLFAAIGTTFGAGDGFVTFNLPDLRGEFLRGWDDGRGADLGREFGSSQAGQNAAHTHDGSTNSGGSHSHSGSASSGGAHGHSASAGNTGAHTHSASSGAAGSHSHSLPSNSSDNTGNGYVGDSTGSGTNRTASTGSAGSHNHDITVGSAGDHTHPIAVTAAEAHSHSLSINSAGSHTHTLTTASSGGTEARPRNSALLACIKF